MGKKMNDEQFVIRVAHIITSDKLTPSEQLFFIKLSYLKMAFPEVEEMPETYLNLIKKLYGDQFENGLIKNE